MEETRIHPCVSTQLITTSSSPFQLLNILPPPLLALVASYLPPVSLLRVQRCSSTLHRLRADESYVTVAWRWAQLCLSTEDELVEWALPDDQCIEGDDDQGERFIPVAVWQAALPVFRAVVAGTREGELAELVRREQPTKWIVAKHDAANGWEAVDDEGVEQSADVQRVEVLRDIDRRYLDENVLESYYEVEVRCRLVLRACLHLQQLDLVVDSNICSSPRPLDTFALVPRLRSLAIKQVEVGHSQTGRVFDFPSMLHSLPRLTSLRCAGIRFLGIAALLDIASHSTLEEVHIDSDSGDIAERFISDVVPDWR